MGTYKAQQMLVMNPPMTELFQKSTTCLTVCLNWHSRQILKNFVDAAEVE
jgi:hypothetical protein